MERHPGAGGGATEDEITGVLLAIAPVTMIIVISQLVPLFISRGSLPFVPFLLITMSRGLVALVQPSPRWLAANCTWATPRFPRRR